MTASHIVTLLAWESVPGADTEAYEQMINWNQAVYVPVVMKSEERLGGDIYQIVSDSPEYPEYLDIFHLENLLTLEKSRKNPDYGNVLLDMRSWIKRDIVQPVWSAVYELVKGFRNAPGFLALEKDTRFENAPFMHIEAYRFSSGDAEKYEKWFTEYAFNIFIPLFMKLPGVKGYDHYRDTGIRIAQAFREKEYPNYLSIIYLDSLEAFKNYAKSHELANFRKNLKNVFSEGTGYQWWVQYRLMKSWRK